MNRKEAEDIIRWFAGGNATAGEYGKSYRISQLEEACKIVKI